MGLNLPVDPAIALPAQYSMTALYTLITFFFIFVPVYLAISAALTCAGWWMARRAAKGKTEKSLAAIDGKIDRLKDKAFVISIVLTFFFVTPFVVIYIFIYS